jgi:hypothetical protein
LTIRTIGGLPQLHRLRALPPDRDYRQHDEATPLKYREPPNPGRFIVLGRYGASTPTKDLLAPPGREDPATFLPGLPFLLSPGAQTNETNTSCFALDFRYLNVVGISRAF